MSSIQHKKGENFNEWEGPGMGGGVIKNKK